jgi:hypothetical protein
MNDITTSALAAARLRAIRTHLLPLHRAVLDYERGQYETIHGSMGGPHQALRIVMQHEWFAWLRPLSTLIVQADERLAADEPIRPADVDAFRDEIRGLLQRDSGGATFRGRYQRALQASPEVVIAHGRLAAALAETA